MKKKDEISSISYQADQIRHFLKDNPRNLLLFCFLMDTELSVSQILSLRFKDLEGLEAGEALYINQKETSGIKRQIINDNIIEAFKRLKETGPFKSDAYVFQSPKGDTPLAKSTVSNMVKSWFGSINDTKEAGIRLLRKHIKATKKTDHAEYAAVEIQDDREFFGPIRIATYSETVYQNLLKAIISGEIFPGDILTISRLADQLKVGHMPIREALIRLENDGFIVTHRGKGRIVKQLSTTDLKEILKIRLQLENLAARTAIKICSDNTLRKLGLLHSQYLSARQAEDLYKHLEYNRNFHFTFYRSANMPILFSMITDLWNKVSPYHNILYRDDQFYRDRGSSQTHEHLMNGIQTRSTSLVKKWLSLDLIESAEYIIDKMDTYKKSNKNKLTESFRSDEK